MLLVIETITWKPHIETAIEIALRRRKAGEDVVYCNLRAKLPICEDSSLSHALLDLPETRIRRARPLIESLGIRFLRPPYEACDLVRANRVARELLDNCHSLEDVKRLEYDAFFDIGWGAISSTASVKKSSDISLKKHRTMLRRLIESSILVYDKTRQLINIFRPDEVLLFNGRLATTRAVMRAADSLGSPWKIHERGGDKHRFWVTDCMPHDIDRIQDLMVRKWTPEQEKAGRAFFEARRNRIERDWHSFTTSQDIGRLPASLAPSEELVTFFTSSEDEMLAIGDSFVSETYQTQADAIRAVATAVSRLNNTRLCVRVHPHVASKSQSDRRKLDAVDLPGIIFVEPNEPIDTYALIDRSKVVCTYGSTVGVEATYWGRPSLLFSRSYYDQLGVAECARGAEHILSFLENPKVFPQSATLPYGAFWELLGEPYEYYRADGLHRGDICGIYLDDSASIRLARAVLGPLVRAAGLGS